MSAGEVVAFAPGRVNLIGEHTDYNEGFCLPFAIEAGVTVRALPRGDERISIDARAIHQRDEFALADPQPSRGWRAFPHGVVAELARAGFRLRGSDLEVGGDLPIGRGLSSSAALEVGLALALLTIADEPIPDRVELARLCSRVENEWAGVQTGLLDQLACLFGAAGHAVLLDMRDIGIDLVPLDLGAWRLLVVDSGVAHVLGSSGYNDRREECRRAASALGLHSLREARYEDIERLPPPLDRRLRHVLDENQRVLDAVRALEQSDLPALGRLLDESHASLRDLYEVSVPAVEATVQRLKRAGAAGARMVGGGFGGAVLALFDPDVTPPPDAVLVAPGPGASVARA